MAKQIKTLTQWDTGLVSKHDPRDIKDGALTKAQDVMLDNPGEIRLMGAEDPHHIGSLDDVSVTPGYGLHSFSSDHHIKMSGIITAFTDYDGTATDTVKVTSAGHNLTTGVEVSISGTDNFDGTNKTITVIDADNFYYSAANHGSADTSDDSDSGTSYWTYNPTGAEDTDYSSEPIQGSFKYLTMPQMSGSRAKIHIYHETFNDLLKNRIDLGGNATGIKPVYYSIDNALRVCDANFDNTLNNRIKWFGFVPKREQFLDCDAGSASRTVAAGWYDEDSALPPIGYWGGATGAGNNTDDNLDLNENGSSEYFLVKLFNGDVADDSYEPWDSETDTTDYFVDSVPMRGLSLSVGACGNIATSGDFQGAVGSEHEELELGVAVVYDDEPSRQESLIVKPKDNTVIKTTGSGTAWSNDMSINLSIAVRFSGDTGTAGNDFYGETNTGTGTAGGVTNEWPNRATGLAFYVVKDGFGELEDPLYLGILDFDKELGFTDHAGNLTNWLAGNQPTSTSSSSVLLDAVACCRVNIKRVPTVTYALRNGYNAYSTTQGLRARYSTAAIANRRVYVGNVHYLDGPLAGKNYEDRLLRSPVNKFDVFPHDSYIDVAINDGDKIIALETYKDKLLQFKKNTLYVINISGEDEYLEETHRFMGVKQPWSICKFQDGIGWANEHGFYVYNGKQVASITNERITDDEWADFCGSNSEHSSPLVGYIPKDNQIVIMSDPNQSGDDSDSGNVYIYDAVTDTLTFGLNRGGIELKTNIVSNFDDKCLYGVQDASTQEYVEITNQTANVLPSQAYGQVYVTQVPYSATEMQKIQITKDGTNYIDISQPFSIKTDPTTNPRKWTAMQTIASAINKYSTHSATPFLSIEDNPDTPIYGFTIRALTSGTGAHTASPHLRFYEINDTTLTITAAFTTSGLAGATSGVQQKERVAFARGDQNGVDNVLYKGTLSLRETATFGLDCTVSNKELGEGGGADLTPIEHVINFHLLTNNSQDSNAEINDYFADAFVSLKKDLFGNPIELGGILEVTANADSGVGSDGTANISYFDIQTKSAHAGRPFDISFNIEGGILLRKFDTDSEHSGNMDIRTKDFTFKDPHVRKKVYKLYLTYKADDMGASDSNIYVKYIIDGKDPDTAANWMPMVIKGGTQQYLAAGTNWTRAELIPLSSNSDLLNTIYSVTFRIMVNGLTKGFKLNDMSIIYRNKSIK